MPAVVPIERCSALCSVAALAVGVVVTGFGNVLMSGARDVVLGCSVPEVGAKIETVRHKMLKVDNSYELAYL